MSKSVKILVLALAVVVGIALSIWGTLYMFVSGARDRLEREAKMQVLSFESQLAAEIKLVLQMTKSPVITQFLENPEDEFIANAAVDELKRYQDSFLSKSSFWISTYDNKFYSDCAYAYDLDPEDPAQYWYKMTLYETDVYNFNINYNPDLKQTNLWLNAVVRNERGAPVAVAGTGIPIGNFINGLFASVNANSSFSLFMFNDLAEVTGAANQQLVEDKAHIGDVVSALKGYENYSDQVRFTSSLSSAYILMPMSTIGWTLVLESRFDMEAFKEYSARPFGILLLVVFAIAIVIVLYGLLKPLTMLSATVAEMSSGNADLTKRITIETSGTLPVLIRLVDSFNLFIEKMQGTVKTLKDSEVQLEASRVKLNAGTGETIASIEEIGTDINAFSQSIKKQTSSVQQTASAMNQISANINSLGYMISTQTSAVSDASNAVEEMLDNIKGVNSSVEKLSESFITLERNSSEGVAKHKTMNEKIVQIQAESAMLAEANKVISSIASQTNLLAMNAAIEAAHAGEAGQGFSVVADEIRKLSENSSAQSKTISQELSKIQKSIVEVVSASAEAGAAFDGMSERINSTNMLVREIAQAMHNQEAGSQQINASLLMLNNSSAEVRTASNEMNEGSKTILGEVQVLQSTTLEMGTGMDELDGKSRAMKSVQSSLSSLSKEMDDAISIMHNSLGNFTV